MKEFESSGQCSYSRDLISYVYNEMDMSGRDRFDSHLEDCSSCIEELADLSLSYYSMHEWRKLEFDPIPTPYFELPRTAEKVSLVDRFREIFFPSPAWAVAGSIGAVLLTAMVGLMIWNGSSGSDLASITNVEVVPANSVSNVPAVVDNLSISRDEVARESFDPSEKVNVETLRPEKSGVKLQAKPVRAAAPVRSVRKSTAVVSTATPQLTDFEEVQDESLRLSDIFEDIDTGD